MTRPPFKTGLPADRREVERPSAKQVVRQLGVIAIVAVIWSALLIGFIQITGETDDQPVSKTSASATSTTAAMEPDDADSEATFTQVVEVQPTQESTPTATSSSEEAMATAVPRATPPPTEEPEPAGSDLSFAQDVLPIFESRCVQCHGNSRSEGGLLLNTYQAVMAGSSEGVVVVSGKAADSLLVELIVSGRMPRRGPTLIPSEIATITRWVDGGALDN